MPAGEETPCAPRKTKPVINGLVFLWTECWVGVVLQMIEYSKASVPFVAVERCCGQLRQHDKRLREGAVVLIAHRNNATATTIPARRLALQQVNACGQGTGTAIPLGWGSVCEWRCCTTVHGASHRAHCLQTTLHTAKEAFVIYLDTQLLQPLDG